jgi:Rrf2 family protein
MLTVKVDNWRAPVWVTRKTDYATRAVVALAMTDGDAPLKIHDIAARTRTPASFLEQILPQLRAAGIVHSVRGPNGGYRLKMAAEDITLGRVVRLFQGPIAPIGCATASAPEPCDMSIGCAIRSTWEEVREAITPILESTTFADLARRSSGAWLEAVSLPAEPRA